MAREIYHTNRELSVQKVKERNLKGKKSYKTHHKLGDKVPNRIYSKILCAANEADLFHFGPEVSEPIEYLTQGQMQQLGEEVQAHSSELAEAFEESDERDLPSYDDVASGKGKDAGKQ